MEDEAELTARSHLPGDSTVVWWALALGMAERAGFKIRFKEFLRFGVPVTLVLVAISGVSLWLRYFALA